MYAASGVGRQYQGPNLVLIKSWTNPDQLPCEGIRIDAIDGLGGMSAVQWLLKSRLVQSKSLKNTKPGDSACKDGSPDANRSSIRKRALNGIASCLVLNHPDRYLRRSGAC
jgi:hypothetical protein